jgi:hypothetical protein
MKTYTGPIHGLLEAPHAPWSTATCRIDRLEIGDTVLTGLKAPRTLAHVLLWAGPVQACTLHIRRRHIVAAELHGHIYYCQPEVKFRVALIWSLLAVVGIALIPDARATLLSRALLASPFVAAMLLLAWRDFEMRPLRRRADAVPL